MWHLPVDLRNVNSRKKIAIDVLTIVRLIHLHPVSLITAVVDVVVVVVVVVVVDGSGVGVVVGVGVVGCC